MKYLLMTVLSLILFGFPCCASAYEVPEKWNIVVEAPDEVMAMKKIQLIYRSDLLVSQADLVTAGCSVLYQKEDNDLVHLLAYAPCYYYEIALDVPNMIIEGYSLVQMTLKKQNDNYHLVYYRQPEDGVDNYSSLEEMFGFFDAPVFEDVVPQENRDEATKDANNEALKYIASLKDPTIKGAWRTPLPNGNNKQAEEIVRTALLQPRYPNHNGIHVEYRGVRNEDVLYTLSVEGEQNYTDGILSYESFAESGERLTYVKLKLEGNEVVILDGEIPPLVYE